MPCTDAQLQECKRAFALINMKYGQWLDLEKLRGFQGTDPQIMYNFSPDKSFSAKLFLNQIEVKGCSIIAYRSKDSRLFFNESYYQPATVVHELLHYFTHDNFHSQISFKMNEAVTEYFTQKLLARADEAANEAALWIATTDQTEQDPEYELKLAKMYRFSSFSDRPDRAPRQTAYEENRQKLIAATQMQKQDPRWHAQQPPAPGMPGLPPRKPDMIKRAYFAGDQAAIDLILEAEFMLTDMSLGHRS